MVELTPGMVRGYWRNIMKSQIEQIKSAERAYMITMNDPRDGMSALRFSVYLDDGGGLDVLWPRLLEERGEKRGKKDLLPGQVYSKLRKYPAFHFSLSGCGYNKAHEIGMTLQEINPEIDVYEMNGHMPSLILPGLAVLKD